jgi:amino acid transporter
MAAYEWLRTFAPNEHDPLSQTVPNVVETKLRRRLTLPLLTLYGIGVTVGAGIYVLIGAVAAHAGIFTPLSFVIAATVKGLTVAKNAELCGMFPVAAGEVAYVRAAFRRRWLTIFTGLTMIGASLIAIATVAIGSAGYIAQFVNVPQPVVVMVVIVSLGLVSAWGVLESVVLASIFTIIEFTGLLLIVIAGWRADLPIGSAIFAIPPLEYRAEMAIAFASLLAFFAFTGFEDLTNMAEETHAPERNVPLAMAITLVVTTLLYVLVSGIAVTALPIEKLSASPAPLSLVYREVAGFGPATIGVIAIVATLNTIIAQMTMAIRVVYGMASQGDLPRTLANVNQRTSTPLVATLGIVVLAVVLALIAPFEQLAEGTSLATLIVFALVNLALLKIRLTRSHVKRSFVRVPLVVPILGLMTCLAMIASSFVS